MSKITFDRMGHRDLCQRLNVALEQLGKDLGIKLHAGGGTIGSTELVIKVSAAAADPTVAIDRAKRELDIYGGMYGLRGADYGVVFTSGGKRFKLTGVAPSRPKFPISGECLSTGKGYKFTSYTASQIIAQRPALAA